MSATRVLACAASPMRPLNAESSVDVVASPCLTCGQEELTPTALRRRAQQRGSAAHSRYWDEPSIDIAGDCNDTTG